SQNSIHKLRPSRRRTDEIAIVSGVSTQKRNLLLCVVGGQSRHPHHRLSLVGQKQKRFHGCAVSSIHSHHPLAAIENLRPLHLPGQDIPLFTDSLLLRDRPVYDYSQGS